MKKLILLLLFIPLVSCKDNKKEMLYDLINNMLIDEIEMSAKDLDLEILALNHNSVITANDSIEYYLKQINKYEQDIIEFKYEKDSIGVDGRKFKVKENILYYYVDEVIAVKKENEKKFKRLFPEAILLELQNFKLRNQSIEKNISYLNQKIDRLKLEPEKIFGNNYEATISVITNPKKGQIKKTHKYIFSFNKDESGLLDEYGLYEILENNNF